jgi:hypothetical protein
MMDYEDDFVDQSIESENDDGNAVSDDNGLKENDDEFYEDDDVDEDDDDDEDDIIIQVMNNGTNADINHDYIESSSLYEDDCFELFDNNDDINNNHNVTNNNYDVNENNYLMVGQSFDIDDINHSNYYDGSCINTSSIDYGK